MLLTNSNSDYEKIFSLIMLLKQINLPKYITGADFKFKLSAEKVKHTGNYK